VPQAECELSAAEALKRQSAYGYSGEDMELVISSMATDAIEPTYCMGDDTALPVLAASAHNLYDYFKQRFAQVRVCGLLCALDDCCALLCALEDCCATLGVVGLCLLASACRR